MHRKRMNQHTKTPAAALSLGSSEAVRSGPNSKNMAAGRTMAKRKGRSPGHDSALGASLAVRKFADGGHLGFEAPMERFNLSRKRAEKLESPHFAQGGHINKGMRDIYKMLHSHFESSPPMKKLGATAKEIYDGVPHKFSRHKEGGEVSPNHWIQGAINPEKKGSLHKALHVPMDKKIPLNKLEKAEHSKSPLTRRRARLAETLRGFHHKPQGR